MRIEGSIRPVGDVSFERTTWCKLVTERPELRRPPPKQGINPFTREPHTFRPTNDVAEVVLDGEMIGSAYWSMSDEPLVNVSIEPAGLRLAEEWAAELGGAFVAEPSESSGI